MKHIEDNYDNFDDMDISWMDKLDAIAIDGNTYPIETSSARSEDDDDQELLRLAERLSLTLAPLRELHASDRAQKQRLKVRLKATLAQNVRKRWWFRTLTFAAAILMFLLLGPGVLLEISFANHSNRGGGIGVSDPAQQIVTGTPTTSPHTFILNPTRPPAPKPHSIPVPHMGIKVLLPPVNTPDAVEVDSPFSLLQGGVLNKYFAHYMVAGQDVYLYEDPGTPPTSPNAFNGLNLVSIGHIKGWLNQDTSGNNILNWFQDGFYCQITSPLPISQLADFASHFQLISR
jgi:hypothetical protein